MLWNKIFQDNGQYLQKYHSTVFLLCPSNNQKCFFDLLALELFDVDMINLFLYFEKSFGSFWKLPLLAAYIFRNDFTESIFKTNNRFLLIIGSTDDHKPTLARVANTPRAATYQNHALACPA